jgi:hypothetical protein
LNADVDLAQRVMTIAASTAPRRAALVDAQSAALTTVDWDLLTRQLTWMRLLPTLGPRIIAAGGSAVPPAFVASVAAAIEATQRQDALLGMAADLVAVALAEREIRAAGLKGPVLGEAIFGEPGRRPSGDVDVLVEPARLREAADAVEGLGYGAPGDALVAGGMPLLHLALTHTSGTLPPVELHWRVHWYESRFAAERLLPPEAGAGGWRPEPPDELAALLLFYARDGFTGLRGAADLAAWWDRFGDRVPDDALDRLGARYPELGEAWGVAATVAGRLVGIDAERLGAGRMRLRRRSRVALRLADPRPFASEEQMFAEIGLIDGLLTPPATLPDFVRRQVAPPRRLLRDRAQKARGGRLTSPSGHAVRVLGRYALALGRLLRIPFTARARYPS